MGQNIRGQKQEVQDWASQLEHFQSISMKFDTDYVLSTGQLGCIICDSLWPLIQLYIDEKDQHQRSWDDLVSNANKVKVNVNIYDNHYLD